MRLPLWQVAFTFCLLLVLAGAQMAAQNSQPPMPSKPGFENDQVVVNSDKPLETVVVELKTIY